MLLHSWFAVFIDRRGSLFVPADVKRHLGIGVGESMAVRMLGPALIMLPVTYTLNWPADERGRDLHLSKLLNDSWNGAAPPVMPPLFKAALTAPAAPGQGLVEYEGGAVDERQVEQLVYVNKKGFLPIPEEMKKLMQMKAGDPYMLELQQRDGQVVLVISMVNHTVSIKDYLERKKQQHLRDAKLAEARDRVAAEVARLESRAEELQQQVKELESQVARKRITAGGGSVFSQLLNKGGVSDEQKTIAPDTQSVSNPLPDQMNPHKPPTEALPPGTKWHFGSFGWVKVGDIDYVEPETK